MRRNRLIAAGFATAVTLGLLAVAQPGNANTETNNKITADTAALLAVAQPGNANTETDNKIAADGDVVIFAVQSRATNLANEEVDGNALSLFNAGATTVDLDGWTVEVVDNNGTTTAEHLFTVPTPLLSKQHFVLHTTGFGVNPIDGQAQSAPFSNQPGSDEIPTEYQVTVTSDTPAPIDLVASDDTANITPEGDDPAPQLDTPGDTDELNAFVRRDGLGTDLDNNAFDFAIMPAIWGTHLS